MDYGLEVLDIFCLVQGDSKGTRILYVSQTTVGEGMPLDLQLTDDVLHVFQDFLNDFASPSECKIVHMLGHEAEELAVLELEDQLPIDRGWDHPALVLSD